MRRGKNCLRRSADYSMRLTRPASKTAIQAIPSTIHEEDPESTASYSVMFADGVEETFSITPPRCRVNNNVTIEVEIANENEIVIEATSSSLKQITPPLRKQSQQSYVDADTPKFRSVVAPAIVEVIIVKFD